MWYRGMQLILKEQEVAGKEYDIVFKSRPDLGLLSVVDFNQIDTILSAKNVGVMFNKCQDSPIGFLLIYNSHL